MIQTHFYPVVVSQLFDFGKQQIDVVYLDSHHIPKPG